MREDQFGEPPTRLESHPCPLCGSRDARPVVRAPDRLYGVPGVYQVVRCQSCQHRFTNPRPAAEDLSRYYPADYAPHHGADQSTAASPATRAAESGAAPWYLSRPIRAIPGLRRLYYWLRADDVYLFPPLAENPLRTLELGCAHGGFLQQLRDRGWQAQGVELASEAAERARRRGFEVHVGTLESAQLPAEQFDAAFAWMVIEHVHDPLATLVELHRLLVPCGWLSLSVPNANCWERAIFGNYWFGLQLPTHLQHFSRAGVIHTLDRAGFEVVQVRSQAHLLTLIGSLGLWLRAQRATRRLGQWLLDYCTHPRMWGQVLLAPLAKLLAAWGQTGCLTVLARRKRTPAIS